MGTIIDGILLGFSIAAPIGPTSIEIVRRGSKYGWKSSLIFFLGALLALVTYLAIAIFGISFVLHPGMNTMLILAGTIVLFYLAYDAFMDFRGKNIVFTADAQNGQNFIPGFILTISNPAVLAIWTGIMGAELAATGTIENGTMLSAGIIVGVCAFFLSLIGIVHKCKDCTNKKNFRYISLVAGLLLLYFALRFLFQLAAEAGYFV
jgi:L-lysine exporter family protein LysE/ArgO